MRQKISLNLKLTWGAGTLAYPTGWVYGSCCWFGKGDRGCVAVYVAAAGIVGTTPMMLTAGTAGLPSTALAGLAMIGLVLAT